jgi:hypothetical protein
MGELKSGYGVNCLVYSLFGKSPRSHNAIRQTDQGIGHPLRAPHPSGKQVLVWDTELRGFGILLSGKTNSRSYIAQRTMPNGITRRVTIGSLPEIDLIKAREKAADLIHAMRHGEDPKVIRRPVAVTWTLRKALEVYILARKDLKPESATYYRHEIARNLGQWLDRPLAGITPEEVEARHREIQADIQSRRKQKAHFVSASGAATANQALRIFWHLMDLCCRSRS